MSPPSAPHVLLMCSLPQQGMALTSCGHFNLALQPPLLRASPGYRSHGQRNQGSRGGQMVGTRMGHWFIIRVIRHPAEGGSVVLDEVG